jgi:hypothetical protein
VRAVLLEDQRDVLACKLGALIAALFGDFQTGGQLQQMPDFTW